MCYIKNLLRIILFLCLFISCSESVIPYLKVKDIEISEDIIKLTFSEIPNQNSAIDAFTFFEDNDSVSGTFSFEGNSLYFMPFKKIEIGHNYIIELSSNLEDIYGHSLEFDYVYKFTTKTDTTPPVIVAISPENESFVTDASVTPLITFSESVDRQSFTNAFSISPNVGYFLTWGAEDKTVHINFEKELTKNTVYTIKVSNSLMDLQYNNLVNDFSTNFTYFPPTESEKNFNYTLYGNQIELLQKQMNELSYTTSFSINFTNAVSVDAISSYISIYPDLEFIYYPDWVNKKSVRFEISKKPLWNQPYKLTVKKGIYDEFNQQIETERDYTLIFKQESERPVEFLKAFFLSSPEQTDINKKWFTITCDNIYSDLNIPIENSSSDSQSETNEKKLKLYSVFRISDNASMLKIPSVLKNIKISTTNSCASIIIDNCAIYKNSELSTTPIYDLSDFTEKDKGWNLIAVCFDLTVTIQKASGMIKFTYNKDIEDNIGNTMTDEKVLSYNKT